MLQYHRQTCEVVSFRLCEKCDLDADQFFLLLIQLYIFGFTVK